MQSEKGRIFYGNNIEVDPNIYKNEQPTLVAHLL